MVELLDTDSLRGSEFDCVFSKVIIAFINLKMYLECCYFASGKGNKLKAFLNKMDSPNFPCYFKPLCI